MQTIIFSVTLTQTNKLMWIKECTGSNKNYESDTIRKQKQESKKTLYKIYQKKKNLIF